GSRAWGRPSVVQDDFWQANWVYEQCCIVVRNLGITQLNRRESEAALGRELLLVPWWHKGQAGEGRPTREERALTRWQTSKDFVYAYSLEGFAEPRFGATMGSSFSLDIWPAPPAPSIFLANSVTMRPEGNVWSHELGHVLLNNRGKHVET